MILKLTTLCCGLLLLMTSQQEIVKPLEIFDTVLGFSGTDNTPPIACLFTRQQTSIGRNDCIQISSDSTYLNNYLENFPVPNKDDKLSLTTVAQQIPFIWSANTILKFDFAGIRYPLFAFSGQQAQDDPVIQVMPWTEKEDRFYAYKAINFGKTSYCPIYATLVGVDTRFSQAITAAIYIPSQTSSPYQFIALEFTKQKPTEDQKFDILVSFIGKWSSEADGASNYPNDYTEFASNIQSFVIEKTSGIISMNLNQISISEKDGKINELGLINMENVPGAFESELYVHEIVKSNPIDNDQFMGKFNNAGFLKKKALEIKNSKIDVNLSKADGPWKCIVLIKVSSFRLQELLPPGPEKRDQSGNVSLDLKFTSFKSNIQKSKKTIECKNTLKEVNAFKLLDLTIEKRSLGRYNEQDLNSTLEKMFTTTAQKNYFSYIMPLSTSPRRTFYYCLQDKYFANAEGVVKKGDANAQDKDKFGPFSEYIWPANVAKFQNILNNSKKMEKCASFKHQHFFIFFQLNDKTPATGKFKDNYICTDNENVYVIQKFNFVYWGTADRRKLRKS